MKTIISPAILILIILLLTNSASYSQGCSDAGFCTIHGLKPEEGEQIKLKNQVGAGISYGRGDYSISVTTFYLSYYRQFTKSFGIDFKATSLVSNGNGINSSGASDIFVTADYDINTKTNFVLGVKIPLNNSDKTRDMLPLPMNYQSSLGTWDVIAGAGTMLGNVETSIALQYPLSQNDNQFFATEYPASSVLSTFQSTNKFVRKGDILVRASYPFNVSKNFVLTPGILPIFHLGNDEYTDTSGVKTEIEGSGGLTFNLTLYADFILGNNNILQINGGVPVVTRDSKPEGLARSFVAALNYTFLF